MSSKSLKTSIKLATGSAVALTLAASPLTAQADINPFGMTALTSGYMVADAKSTEGKCGEAKCGGDKAASKSTEGKCGSNKAMDKSSEGKCGGDKGAKSKPIVEAKCGEAKCGGNK